MEKLKKRPSLEMILGGHPDILRVIPNWQNYFHAHESLLSSQWAMYAHGGTLDGVLGSKGWEPVYHPVNIISTRGLSGWEIFNRFQNEKEVANNLGELYKWTTKQLFVPWMGISIRESARLSSFDSGQETEPHFAAGTKFNFDALQFLDGLIKTKGTDSMVEQVSLDAMVLLHFLFQNDKRLIYVGSSESGEVPNSLAIDNISGGLFASLEKALPSGVFVVSASRIDDETLVTRILPGLGSVKLHSDGIFYTPNSTPLLTVIKGVVYKHPLLEELIRRIQYVKLLPDFPSLYLQNEVGVNRLQRALEQVHLDTVKNAASGLDDNYNKGKRVFVVKARGSGNGPLEWKEKIAEILDRGDTTVMVITMADSGDVNLKKYKAGLDVEGALSGRTLREDAALTIAGIIHDLKLHNQLNMDPQKMIELYCYLSGMIDLNEEELKSSIHSPTP